MSQSERPDLARLAALGQLGERIRPVVAAGERILPVPEILAPLLPQGGLQRGTLAATTGVASSSVALSLIAPTTAAGGWVAVVGLTRLGLVAAAELGVDLGRVLLVDEPEAKVWPSVVDALLDAFEIVVVRPSGAVGAGVQRRLMARARDRGSVLIQMGGARGAWAQAPDLVVDTTEATWSGLAAGHGLLRARRLTVAVTGRRGADRPRRAEVLLPGPLGVIAPLALGPALSSAEGLPSDRIGPFREVG